MRKAIKNKVFKLYSLQFLIAVACIAVSIIPMTYTGFSVYTKYSRQLVSNSEIFADQIMEQVRINIEEYIESAIKVNNDVAALVEDSGSYLNEDTLNQLNDYYSARNDVVSMAFITEDGIVSHIVPQREVKSDYHIGDEAWFSDLIEGQELYHISEPQVQNLYNGSHDWVISVYKRIELYQPSGQKKRSVLKLDVSITALDEICNNLNLGGSGYVYITNQENEIIYHPQQALIFSGYKEELNGRATPVGNDRQKSDEILTINKPVSFVDWNLIGVTYIKDIYESNSRIAQEVIAAIPLILVIIILLSWYISGRITHPIKALEKQMHKVQMGDLETQIVLENGEKEVVELGKSFNIMVQTVNALVEENKIEHEAKRISELNALQAQINPHFLYNTLDSIMWMAECNLNEEVVEMVTALARLFRISISKGQNVITVEEEIEHAKNYLLIQKIRYKDKFTFSIDVEDRFLSHPTPKLILQPIIENAIYHGIEYMVDEGTIRIHVYQEGDNLVFQIKDNGLGMDEATVQKLLFTKDFVPEPHQGSGVGVRNVDERIKIRYGNDYGIWIESEIEEGTIVEIRIPFNGGDEDEQV